MARCTLLATLLLPLRGDASSGNTKCPCVAVGSALDSYIDPNDANCRTPATDDGKTHCYPADYGGAGCKKYESTLPPSCADNAGNALPGRPSWCDDAWCWVDTKKCNTDYIDDALPSVMFPNSGLFYSYGTCGFEQTFAKWQYAQNQTALELKATTESYMKDIRDQIEQHITQLAQDENQGNCDGAATSACDCGSCKEKEAWTEQTSPRTPQIIDFMKTNVVVAQSKFNSRTDAMNRDKCSSALIGKSMRKVALREYNDVHRIAYIYYGSQATGAMTQWPASQWCTDFDARMRPWYAVAASGPKDVILVLDRSGSMNTAGRWPAVVEAAKKVLLTLGSEDFATVVTFSSTSEAYEDTNGLRLHRMTDNKRKKMEVWLDSQSAVGGTNFRSGLKKAGMAFTNAVNSGGTSKCTQVLLFLTDGVDTEGFKAKDVQDIEGLEGVTFLTYSFGNDIGDQQVVKKMACQNRGIWYKVPDGGDISSIMASYYQIFASSLDAKEARWIEYDDGMSGTSLVAACYSVYDRTSAVSLLNGVACMDLNIIVDIPAFTTKPGYDAAWEQMRAAATSCTPIRVSAEQLKTFRSMQGGECKECDMTDENCPTEGVSASGALPGRRLVLLIVAPAFLTLLQAPARTNM
eukprot:TRINITY_DN8085_c0_g1_i1.p1 TRINITY_DN8085_c0_g1~~TRINITY_DN8085_c0_g1_i1.p1  ORF type:complete len:648 (+),score=113.88 TRINITY_DN8085_c0_g1_i1:45-1946(+)